MAELEFRDALREALDEELGARRAGRLHRRGRRRGRRCLCGHPRVARKARRSPCDRHADLGARPRRRCLRKRDHGSAARRRDHVRGFPSPRHGQPDQPGDEVLVSLERERHRADRDPVRVRRRRAVRGDPLADAGVLAARSAGVEDRVPVHPGRRQGPAEVGDPRRQPRSLSRAQAPLLAEGRDERRAGPARAERRSCARAPT